MAKIKSPLNLLCGKGKVTNQTHYIYFHQENIYVSNGNVAIKQRMELHGFTKADMRNLDGICIHKDVFKIIKNKEMSMGLGSITIEILGLSIIRIPFLPTYEVHGGKQLIKQIDKSFDTFEMVKTSEVAINPDYITLLRKVMVTESSGFTFRFNEATGGVLVTPNKSNLKEHAMITPLVITGELC